MYLASIGMNIKPITHLVVLLKIQPFLQKLAKNQPECDDFEFSSLYLNKSRVLRIYRYEYQTNNSFRYFAKNSAIFAKISQKPARM